MIGPAVSLPRMVLLTLVTGTGPPAVVAVKTSSADRNSSELMSVSAQGMPRSAQISKTVFLEMPSSIPDLGVSTFPSITAKILKPGPSVI